MSAADAAQAGPFADGGNRPAFARGDALVVTNLTALNNRYVVTLDEDMPSALRVLAVEDLGDGWRLTVEPLTGEEPTDG